MAAGDAKKKKGGKKNRKWDKNRIWCAAYRNRNQAEKNKLRRINRHIKRFPDDKVAVAAAQNYKDVIRGIAKIKASVEANAA